MRDVVAFDSGFMRAPRHRISFEEWRDAGLSNLLRDRPMDELLQILVASAAQLADFLRRGMQSTARTRMTEFRNLAESIAATFPDSTASREQGYLPAKNRNLQQAMEWHTQIGDSIHRAYTLLGITDHVFPARE